MMTAVTPSNDGESRTGQKADNEVGGTCVTASNILAGSSLDQIDLEPDNAADIEALEQSLTALLDDFRSGRMSACEFFFVFIDMLAAEMSYCLRL